MRIFQSSVILILLAIVACGGSTPPAPGTAPSNGIAPGGAAAPARPGAPAAAGQVPAAAAPVEEKKNPLAFLKEEQLQEFYNPSGKRDPFKVFEGGEIVYTAFAKAPLERFELNQLELTAIVWGIARPKILFRAPDGYSYIAQVGTSVGRNRGRITKITKNRVLISEEFRDPAGQYVARESEFVMETDNKKSESGFKEAELKYSDE
jgi:Tfp pilus assembly protein PilP